MRTYREYSCDSWDFIKGMTDQHVVDQFPRACPRKACLNVYLDSEQFHDLNSLCMIVFDATGVRWCNGV